VSIHCSTIGEYPDFCNFRAGANKVPCLYYFLHPRSTGNSRSHHRNTFLDHLPPLLRSDEGKKTKKFCRIFQIQGGFIVTLPSETSGKPPRCVPSPITPKSFSSLNLQYGKILLGLFHVCSLRTDSLLLFPSLTNLLPLHTCPLI
jgi:hypothetical protein